MKLLYRDVAIVVLSLLAAGSAVAVEKTTRKQCLDHFEAWKATPPGPSEARDQHFAALQACYENESFTEDDLKRMYNDM
jgi:hypothetical protein